MTNAAYAFSARTGRRPAAWLVASGIVGAVTVCVSCLTILLR